VRALFELRSAAMAFPVDADGLGEGAFVGAVVAADR
jgi:hypothetical protein